MPFICAICRFYASFHAAATPFCRRRFSYAEAPDTPPPRYASRAAPRLPPQAPRCRTALFLSRRRAPLTHACCFRRQPRFFFAADVLFSPILMLSAFFAWLAHAAPLTRACRRRFFLMLFFFASAVYGFIFFERRPGRHERRDMPPILWPPILCRCRFRVCRFCRRRADAERLPMPRYADLLPRHAATPPLCLMFMPPPLLFEPVAAAICRQSPLPPRPLTQAPR